MDGLIQARDQDRQYNQRREPGPWPGDVPGLKQKHEAAVLVRPHREFILEGEPVRGAFLIMSGAMLLSRTTEDGRRHVLAILGAGDVFGLTTGLSYDETAEALCFTLVRAISPGSTPDRHWPALIGEQVLKQLQRSRSHMVLLQRRSAEEKIAALILGLPAVDETQGLERRIMLSLIDAADYLSLRMETVSRVLSRFRKRGYISMPQRGRIIIQNALELARIARPLD